VPRDSTRRQVALSLDAQLAAQLAGQPEPKKPRSRVAGAEEGTDSGAAEPREAAETIEVVDTAAFVAAHRLVPVADAVDSAVFGGTEVDDEVVERTWTQAEESLATAGASAGRLRRLFSRFRLRSKRDWNRVNVRGSRGAARGRG